MTAGRPRLLRGADSAAAQHGSSHRPRTRREQSAARQGGRHLGIAGDNASPSADKTDTPESLPRLSEKADLMVLGHDHPALGGHMPYRDLSAGRSSVRHAPLGIG
jgi:hypothetical protein